MQEDERRILIEPRQRIAARNRRTQRVPDFRPRAFSQFEVALDGVLAPIYFCSLMIKPARAFARIAHSEDLLCAADLGDERAAEQSLKIEGKIGLQLFRLL